MAGTDGIEIVLLHQGKVGLYLPHAGRAPCYRVGIMAVHAPEFDFLPVKINYPVPNLYGPKPNIVHNHLILRRKNYRI